VASSSFPANTIAELIAAAKKEPGKFNFASVGLGSYPHLDMERFMKAAGIELTHVPYTGGAGQAIPAMLGGEVQLAFFNMASLLPHIKSGRLKALAAIPTQRLPELPNVPTLTEQGFPGIGTNAWQGMFAPAAPKAGGRQAVRLGRRRAEQSRGEGGPCPKMRTVTISSPPCHRRRLQQRKPCAGGETKDRPAKRWRSSPACGRTTALIAVSHIVPRLGAPYRWSPPIKSRIWFFPASRGSSTNPAVTRGAPCRAPRPSPRSVHRVASSKRREIALERVHPPEVTRMPSVSPFFSRSRCAHRRQKDLAGLITPTDRSKMDAGGGRRAGRGLLR
jgi:hypothetical protein